MDFIIVLKTIVLGIVEGITEWLPISSTGHLILFGNVLNLGMSDEFMEMFDVVIQLGAILAVVVLFFRQLWPFHTAKKEQQWFLNPREQGAAGKLQHFANKYVHMGKISMWLKIFVSCLPAVIIGLPLDDWLNEHLYNAPVVAIMLILYGVLFIVIENYNKKRTPGLTRISRITWKEALLVGLFQVLALIPGTSRSGATIIGGILIGMSRTLAARYTFYLAIPTMLGASLLKLVKFGFHFSAVELAVLAIGMVVAFAVSILVIRFLMDYIRKHDFKVFGWYRIVLGILVIILTLCGVVQV